MNILFAPDSKASSNTYGISLKYGCLIHCTAVSELAGSICNIQFIKWTMSEHMLEDNDFIPTPFTGENTHLFGLLTAYWRNLHIKS